jgi:hypothetical protein
MTQAYIVTEGKSIAEILKRLLPENILRDTHLIAGSNSALSSARTILVVKRLPVAFVVDANTNHQSTILEREDLLNYSLRQVSPGIPFEVFLAVPEMEIVFLQDRSFIEKLAHRNFTDLEWKLAQLQPREFLSSVLGEGFSPENMLNELTDSTIDVLRKHSLIRKLSEFLASVIQVTKLFFKKEKFDQKK